MSIWNKTLKDMYEGCYFAAHDVSEISDEEANKKCLDCEFYCICLETPDRWNISETEKNELNERCADSDYSINSHTIMVEKGGIVNVYNNYK